MEKINDYLHQQKQDSAYKFSCAMTEFLAATTKERLYRHSREYNWKISNLPHTNMKKVVVIKKSKSDFPELWVSSTYTRYRNAIKTYLKHYFGIERLPSEFHVDHLLPKNTFGTNHPEYFIRLFLIPSYINCGYGAFLEKKLSTYESEKDINGGYHVSYENMYKIMNIKPLKKTKSYEEVELWAKNTAFILSNEIKENPNDSYPFIARQFAIIFGITNVYKYYQLSFGYTYVDL